MNQLWSIGCVLLGHLLMYPRLRVLCRGGGQVWGRAPRAAVSAGARLRVLDRGQLDELLGGQTRRSRVREGAEAGERGDPRRRSDGARPRVDRLAELRELRGGD